MSATPAERGPRPTGRCFGRISAGVSSEAMPQAVHARLGRDRSPARGARRLRRARKHRRPPAPNVMWGTDGVRVFTLDDGWGWIFAAVEHGNAECGGWHVCKVGSRFAALDPIAHGLERLYGSLDARRRPWASASDGSRSSVPVRPLPQADPVLGDPPQLRLCRGTGNERGGGAVESHAQGASDPRPNLSEPRGRPRRRGRLRGAVQPDLASREAWVSHADRGARGVCVSREPGAVQGNGDMSASVTDAPHERRNPARVQRRIGLSDSVDRIIGPYESGQPQLDSARR